MDFCSLYHILSTFMFQASTLSADLFQTTPGIGFACLSSTFKHMPVNPILTLPKHSRPRHVGPVTIGHAYYLPAHVRTFISSVHSGDLVDVPESCSIYCTMFAGTPRMQLSRPGLPRVWQSSSSLPSTPLLASTPNPVRPKNPTNLDANLYDPPSTSDDHQLYLTRPLNGLSALHLARRFRLHPPLPHPRSSSLRSSPSSSSRRPCSPHGRAHPVRLRPATSAHRLRRSDLQSRLHRFQEVLVLFLGFDQRHAQRTSAAARGHELHVPRRAHEAAHFQ